MKLMIISKPFAAVLHTINAAVHPMEELPLMPCYPPMLPDFSKVVLNKHRREHGALHQRGEDWARL
jgi:hypothetical protein